MLCAGFSLFITSAVVGLTLVVLIVTARHPSAITQETLKNEGVLFTRPGNYTTQLGPQRSWVNKASLCPPHQECGQRLR